MSVKLFDSELKIMEVLWKEGELTAGQLAALLKEQTGWNRNTTYTVIKKLVDKGAVERSEPGFICKALITKEQVRQREANDLLNKLFDNSADLFLSAYLNGKRCGFSKRYFLVLVACRHLTCTKTECRKMFLSLIAPLTTIRLNRGKRSNRLPYIFAQGQER